MAPQNSHAPPGASHQQHVQSILETTRRPWKGSDNGAYLRKLEKREGPCSPLSQKQDNRTSRLFQQQRLNLANNNKLKQYNQRQNAKLHRSIEAVSNNPLNSSINNTNNFNIPIPDLLRASSTSSGPILTPIDYSTMATMNCRRMLARKINRGKTVLWMIKHSIDIVALQDHGVKPNDYFRHGKKQQKKTLSPKNKSGQYIDHISLGWGYNMFFSENVGFITSPHVRILNLEAIGDRIFRMEVKSLTEKDVSGNLNSCTLLSVYAPHSGLDENVKHIFYELLLDTTHKYSLAVVLGDFNAVIEKNRCGSKVDTGNIADGKTRVNSDLLMNYLDFNGLVSLGTLKNATKNATFFGTKNIPRTIDHILFPESWINSSCTATTMDSPFGSDHRPVIARIKIKLAVPKAKQLQKPDLSTLRNGASYNEEIVERVLAKALQAANSWENCHANVTDSLDCIPRSKPLNLNLDGSRSPKNADIQAVEAFERIAKYVNAKMKFDAANAWKAIKSEDPKPAPLPDLPPEAWYEYFKNLFLQLKPPDFDTVPNLDIPKIDFGENAPIFLLGPIQLEECMQAIQRLNNDKATGLDNIPYELLKLPGLAELMLPFINDAYSGRPVPQWLVSEIVPIFKNKGDRSKPCNYRPISLISCCAKLYNLILLIRLRKALDGCLRTNQNGFRPNRGISEHTLCIQRIIQLAKAEGRTVILTFVDFCNAFNSVYWHTMQEALAELNVPKELITAIMSTLHGATSVVRTADGHTDPFECFAGVLQGDPLSPFIFICVIDVVMRKAMKDVKGFTFHYKKRVVKPDGSVKFESSTQDLTDLNYADDLILFCQFEDANCCQATILQLDSIASKYGLKINYAIGKTEILVVGATPSTPLPPILSSTGSPINVVRDYKYLGSYLLDNGAEVTRRIGLAWVAARKSKNLFHSNLHISKKAQIFYSLVVSILLSSSETWTLTTALVTRLSGAYTNLVRFILQKKVWSWETRLSNDNLFQDYFIHFKDLLIKRTLTFAGHCARSTQPISLLILAEPQHHARCGRPALTYPAMLSRITGLSPETLRSAILDSSLWEKVIEDSVAKCAIKRAAEKLKSKANVTEIIPYDQRPGRKRSINPSNQILAQRKRLAKQALKKLVCTKCKIKHCQTHCLLCSTDQNNVLHYNMKDQHYLCCDLCFRLCGRNCLCPSEYIGLATLDFSCFDEDSWLEISSKEKFLCKDCTILHDDLTDKFKPPKPKFPFPLNKCAKTFFPGWKPFRLALAPAAAPKPDAPRPLHQQGIDDRAADRAAREASGQARKRRPATK